MSWRSTGVACTSADLNSRLWLQKYIGKYIASGTWQDIKSLYPNFQVMEVTDLLTRVQLADASATSSIISNYTAVSTLLFSFSGSLDDFGAYLDTFQNYALKNPTLLSPKIKEAILMAVADALFPLVGSLSVQVTEEWLNRISFLLPAINSTILGEIPLAISCDKYQLFVTAFDGVYNSLKSTTKQDIATFQKSFLVNKYTMEEDGCSLGTSSTASYIQNNIGLFCKQFTAAEVIQFNPAISEVSFTEFCNLS
ncbi:uncharacterized protein LOC121008721 [Bufo bufo]|uniref:uncharacterized protein LOC121008721 n=1 Tax=Bufo bufo TaxID=8384 RepID=UPI001ABDA1AA|nr:uncharacterized protein LOC121008721 [Bufo bufo]